MAALLVARPASAAVREMANVDGAQQDVDGLAPRRLRASRDRGDARPRRAVSQDAFLVSGGCDAGFREGGVMLAASSEGVDELALCEGERAVSEAGD